MTIASATPSYIQIPGNGTATNFAFPFKIFAATDLLVGFITSSGYALQSSGFTVQNIDINGGGNLLFSVAPSVGVTVDIRTATPLTQTTEFANLGAFLPEAHTEAFDRLTREMQDLYRLTYTFGIHGPDQEAAPWTQLPAASVRANGALVFDSNGFPAIGVPVTGTITGPLIAGLLNPVTTVAPTADKVRTPAEIAAGVTPTNYAYPPYTWLRYGGDPTGAIDSTVALQNAINCAAQAGDITVTSGISGGQFKVGSAWTCDINKVSIDFQGAYVSALAFSGTNWLTIQQSNTNLNLRPPLNSAHPIRNVVFQGPGAQIAGCVCVYINDGVNNQIAGGRLLNIGFPDWATSIYFGAGAFEWVVDGFFMIGTSFSSGYSTTYQVIQPNSSNSGERNTLANGGMTGHSYGIQCLDVNADIKCLNVSLDYLTQISIYNSGGNIDFQGGHLESNFDNAHWVQNYGSGGRIQFTGTTVLVSGNLATHSPFYCDSTVVAGGIKLQDPFLAISGGVSLGTSPLCAGTGLFNVRGLREYASASRPPISAASNQFAYGTFESASYADDWTLANGATRSSAQNHTPSGTYSLSFPGTSVLNPSATRNFSAKPGATVHGQIWGISPSFTSGTFLAQWTWTDAAGTAIGSAVFIIDSTSAIASWTSYPINAQAAPAGTSGGQLFVQVFGVSSGTQTGYIDDVICEVIDP